MPRNLNRASRLPCLFDLVEHLFRVEKLVQVEALRPCRYFTCHAKMYEHITAVQFVFGTMTTYVQGLRPWTSTSDYEWGAPPREN